MRYSLEKQRQLNHVRMAIKRGVHTVNSMGAKKKVVQKMLEKRYHRTDALTVNFISYGTLVQCSFLIIQEKTCDFHHSN